MTLLDRLPQLADAMDHDVIPLLGHLDQVGPDLNQLLDRVSQLSHMASRLPTVFRRRNDQISGKGFLMTAADVSTSTTAGPDQGSA